MWRECRAGRPGKAGVGFKSLGIPARVRARGSESECRIGRACLPGKAGQAKENWCLDQLTVSRVLGEGAAGAAFLLADRCWRGIAGLAVLMMAWSMAGIQ